MLLLSIITIAFGIVFLVCGSCLDFSRREFRIAGGIILLAGLLLISTGLKLLHEPPSLGVPSGSYPYDTHFFKSRVDVRGNSLEIRINGGEEPDALWFIHSHGSLVDGHFYPKKVDITGSAMWWNLMMPVEIGSIHQLPINVVDIFKSAVANAVKSATTIESATSTVKSATEGLEEFDGWLWRVDEPATDGWLWPVVQK